MCRLRCFQGTGVAALRRLIAKGAPEQSGATGKRHQGRGTKQEAEAQDEAPCTLRTCGSIAPQFTVCSVPASRAPSGRWAYATADRRRRRRSRLSSKQSHGGSSPTSLFRGTLVSMNIARSIENRGLEISICGSLVSAWLVLYSSAVETHPSAFISVPRTVQVVSGPTACRFIGSSSPASSSTPTPCFELSTPLPAPRSRYPRSLLSSTSLASSLLSRDIPPSFTCQPQ
jgi:hypothetical protein